MRRSQKKEIFRGINILKTAQRKLKLMLCGTANELLEQCQELAIAIGETIEKYEKTDSITVNYLEEYCELLYKAYMSQNKNEYIHIVKEIGNSLKKIEESVKKNIKDDPYEIVFLPYKASMWDSFDTVYRAVERDEECHVVVMPVPYYNLNKKNQQIELHYEGNQFPSDISITDFQMYSLEEMYPDVIFIHNPYDQYNYVTQLPEQYFSSNLVLYTHHLVYIPYFVTRGIDIKETYCTLPAVKNAWKTFVQCESVRKCYIKYGADPDRIVTMGSPKFDMVINMQKNPPEIPENWQMACDGRKIFLLNTHLNSIINEAEKMIDKLHKIFELFRQRDDVALLWRPHPLSIETAKAMNPQILGRYLKIIDEFKTLNNGIYDDTPDVHRAIAVSDAYIGDWSSMVALYGFTGKPMYIMNINIDTNIEESEKEKRLAFSCMAEIDGNLWVPGDDVNGLFQVCKETGESRFVTSFAQEDSCGTSLYRRVIAYGRKLFFIPWEAEHIAEYHVDTGIMKYYEIYNNREEGKKKFGGYVVKEQLLYLFSIRIRDIICLNMDTGELSYHKPELKGIPSEVLNSPMAKISMFINEINVKNLEYLPCLRTNMFIKLSLDSFQGEAVEIPGSEKGFIDMTNHKESLYLLSIGGDIFRYDLKTGKSDLFWENCERRIDGTLPHYRIIHFNGYLWLLPAYADYIYKIDIKSSEAKKVDRYPEGFKYVKDQQLHPCKWFNGEVIGGKLRLYPYQANMLLEWDNVQDKANGIIIKKPQDGRYKNYRFSQDKKGCLYYETEYSLFYFLNIIIRDQDIYQQSRKEYFRGLQYQTEGLYGEHIWKYIKSELY